MPQNPGAPKQIFNPLQQQQVMDPELAGVSKPNPYVIVEKKADEE